MPQTTFLITGATGKTGRRVTRLLRDRGHTVREGSRSARIPFDWDDSTTWAAALDGVSAVYVVLPALGNPAIIDQVREFARLAASLGVKKAVLLSFPAAGGMDVDTVTATENKFVEAGLALTILRLRWFSQNFSEGFLLDSVVSGELRLPAGDGREAFVDADDIAEVAVAALLDERHNGRSYELTGPRLLSFATVADELSRATGRSITYVPLTIDQFVAEQEAQGVPVEWAGMLGSMYAHLGTGALASVSDDITVVLGKPARDFGDYAAAAAGTWNG